MLENRLPRDFRPRLQLYGVFFHNSQFVFSKFAFQCLFKVLILFRFGSPFNGSSLLVLPSDLRAQSIDRVISKESFDKEILRIFRNIPQVSRLVVAFCNLTN